MTASGCSLRFIAALACLSGPLPSTAQPQPTPFTLAHALARAGAEAPEAAAMRARVDAARQAADQAGRLRNPTVEFRVENWASGVSRSDLPLDTFAEVTQPLELGGKRAARRGVADAGLAAAEAGEALTRRTLALEVSHAYLEAVRLRDRQRVEAAHVTDLAEAVRVVGRRAAVGTAAEAEVLKLRTEQARAEASLLRLELGASRALLHLASRLNIETTLDALVAPPPPVISSADEAAAIERRPDVQAATRRVESARQSLRLEDALAVPDLAVNGGLKRTLGLNTGQVTLTMALPIFDRNRLARILAQGQVTAAELDLAATERRARGELAISRGAATRLAERARQARAQLVEPARGARDAARAAFATGVLDVLRLVDAERTFADASQVAIDLEIDAVMAAIDARLAAGEDPLP